MTHEEFSESFELARCDPEQSCDGFAGGRIRSGPSNGCFTRQRIDRQRLSALQIGGIGIALQAEALFQDDLNAGRLVRVLEDYAPQSLPMHMLYSPARLITPKLRSFVDFSAAHFG